MKKHPLSRYSGINTISIKSPYCFRCPFNKSKENCSLECADFLDDVIQSNKDKIAAMIIEPVLGRECIPLPEGYLKRVETACKNFGIMLIVDEIKTGSGRTGTLFAFEQENISADIVCMGKSLSNGFPLSLTIFKEQTCPRDFLANYILLQTTFSGHSVACARAHKVVELLTSGTVLATAKQNSAYLLDKLQSILLKSDYIGDVRGKGMMFGIEFVKDKKDNEPSITSLYQFINIALSEGLFFSSVYQNTLVFTPPIILIKNDIDLIVEKLSNVLRKFK
jgi:4-aminobutyrate aminotransferase-like enzyme